MNRIATSLVLTAATAILAVTSAGTAAAASGLKDLDTPALVKHFSDKVSSDAADFAKLSFVLQDGLIATSTVSDLGTPLNLSRSEMDGLREMSTFAPLVQITEIGAARLQATLLIEGGITGEELDAELTSLHGQVFRSCLAGSEIADQEAAQELVTADDIVIAYTIVTNASGGSDAQNTALKHAFDIGLAGKDCFGDLETTTI